MNRILVVAILLSSVLLTIYLVQKKRQQQAEQVTTTITPPPPLDSIKSHRKLSFSERGILQSIDAYADSIYYQQIPFHHMNVSPGFWTEKKGYYSAEFNSSHQHMPLSGLEKKVYSDELTEHVYFTFQNANVIRRMTSKYFGLGLDQEHQTDYFKENNGSYIGSKTQKIHINRDSLISDTITTYFVTLDSLEIPSLNDQAENLINAALGRGDFALKIDSINTEETPSRLFTRTFNDNYTAEFEVAVSDETFKQILENPTQNKGKIIAIEKTFGINMQKGGRKNFYNGGKIFN